MEEERRRRRERGRGIREEKRNRRKRRGGRKWRWGGCLIFNKKEVTRKTASSRTDNASGQRCAPFLNILKPPFLLFFF